MGVLDTIFPVFCLECGRKGEYLCKKCLDCVSKAKLFCVKCKKRSIDGLTHSNCHTKFSPELVCSVWNYEKVVRSALLRLKYNFAKEIANELGVKLCVEVRKSELFRNKKAYLSVVPLHRYRKNWRGFNQSEELAKYISKDLGWKFLPDLLIRKKGGQHQAELRGEDRVKNIKGVFGFNDKYKKLCEDDKPVIIFDDVLTTGSTISECTKALKVKGIKKVWGLTVAA